MDSAREEIQRLDEVNRARPLARLALYELQRGQREVARLHLKEALACARWPLDIENVAEVYAALGDRHAVRTLLLAAGRMAAAEEDSEIREVYLRVLIKNALRAGFEELVTPLIQLATTATTYPFDESSSDRLRTDAAIFQCEWLAHRERNWTTALEMARQLPCPLARRAALEHIAFEQAGAGYNRESRDAFAEAMKAGLEIRPRAHLLIEVARAHASSDDLEGARAVAIRAFLCASAADWAENSRHQTIAQLAGMWTELGNDELALQTLSWSKWEAHSSSEFLPVVDALAQRGDVIKALKLARQIRDTSRREQTFSSVALVAQQQGRIDIARRAARQINRGPLRTLTFLRIAEHYANAADLDAAAKLLPDPLDSDSNAVTILYHLALRDGATSLLNRLDEFRNPTFIRGLLFALAAVSARRGEWDELTRCCRDGESRYGMGERLLAHAAAAFADSDRCNDALQVLNIGLPEEPLRIDSPCCKAATLTAIAAAYAKSGDAPAARETFQTALTALKAEPITFDRVIVLARIAATMSRHGWHEEARAALAMIDAAENRASYLWMLARQQVVAGKFAEAVLTAASIDYERSDHCVGIISKLVAAGDCEHFPKLLPFCADRLGNAYRACACTLRAFPELRDEIRSALDV